MFQNAGKSPSSSKLTAFNQGVARNLELKNGPPQRMQNAASLTGGWNQDYQKVFEAMKDAWKPYGTNYAKESSGGDRAQDRKPVKFQGSPGEEGPYKIHGGMPAVDMGAYAPPSTSREYPRSENYSPGRAQPREASPGSPYRPGSPEYYERMQAATEYLRSVNHGDAASWSDEQIEQYNRAARESRISHTASYSRNEDGNVVRHLSGHTGPKDEVLERSPPGGSAPTQGTPTPTGRPFPPIWSSGESTQAAPSQSLGAASANYVMPSGLGPAATAARPGPQLAAGSVGMLPPGWTYGPTGDASPPVQRDLWRNEPLLNPVTAQPPANRNTANFLEALNEFARLTSAVPAPTPPRMNVRTLPSVVQPGEPVPVPGFTAQYQQADGTRSSNPGYAERDALIQGINDALLPYHMREKTGAPLYDIPTLQREARERASAGYQNPFLAGEIPVNPLAALFG